jgi:hypothetical protein
VHVISVGWWWKVGEVSASKCQRKVGGKVPSCDDPEEDRW